MVTALQRKLLRDLAGMKGQLVTIALVVACGITSYVTLRSTYESLTYSRDRYYAETRFADAFCTLSQAPNSLLPALESIAGVARVQARIVKHALVPMPDMDRPASGTILSREANDRNGELNAVVITQGRDLDPARADEALLLERFAVAHQLEPGDSISVVLNGKLKRFHIVGIAMSPEYVMALAPGSMVYDPARVPVVWLNRKALAAAYDAEGAFNDITLAFEPGAAKPPIVAEVDRMLRPYGGYGALLREKQTSNYLLNGELQQLAGMARLVPYLFLFVAAVLVNIVLARLIQLQRAQIATLKAVGYTDGAIGRHYAQLVSAIVVSGALFGLALGALLGVKMVGMYTGEWFRFPRSHYHLSPETVAFALSVSFATAFLGAWVSVRGIMRLSPAEAMQPPTPPTFRRSFVEQTWIWQGLSPAARMILRELSRRPLRVLVSAIGIAMAVGILVVGRSTWDAIDFLMNIQVHNSLREDLAVTFERMVPSRALRDLEHIPGVIRAEGLRSVPVRFRAGHRTRDAVINGYPPDISLRQLLDSHARPQGRVPDHGLVLTTQLARILDVVPGDQVDVEVRAGRWRTARVRVAALIDEPLGLAGHMDSAALNALAGDAGGITTALLQIDTAATSEIERALKRYPMVVDVSSPKDFRRQFDEQSAAIIGVFTGIMVLFAGIIAVGIVYNNIRVALSQRSREFASLRVLGYTSQEIARILFGEQMVQVALGIPVGLWLGRFLSAAMMSNNDPDQYRLRVIVSSTTYAFATGTTLLATLLSALIVNRKVRSLDLIGVLKTRQ